MIKEEEKDPNCKVVEFLLFDSCRPLPLLFLLSIEFEVFAPKDVIVRSEGMKCPAYVDTPVLVIRDLLGRLRPPTPGPATGIEEAFSLCLTGLVFTRVSVTRITGTINRNETRSFYLSSKEANPGPISIGHTFPYIVK
jgi:hypothetical protein